MRKVFQIILQITFLIFFAFLTLTGKVQLDEQDVHTYPVGSIIIIPYKTKMNVFNQHDEPMEIFVVKAPNPKHMS